MKEIQISCFVVGITWYLQEIESSRLYEFGKVLKYHEKVVGSPIDAGFNLVLGNESSTNLPPNTFDRILMFNVFHEIESRSGIMTEIRHLLNEDGELGIMERMGKTDNEIHGDCNFPKLIESNFLKEMNDYGYRLKNKVF